VRLSAHSPVETSDPLHFIVFSRQNKGLAPLKTMCADQYTFVKSKSQLLYDHVVLNQIRGGK